MWVDFIDGSLMEKTNLVMSKSEAINMLTPAQASDKVNLVMSEQSERITKFFQAKTRSEVRKNLYIQVER